MTDPAALITLRDVEITRRDFTLRVDRWSLPPGQVIGLVGPNGEGAALGVVNMLIQLSGFTQPFIGAWSDRCGSSWGKRRPFIFW